MPRLIGFREYLKTNLFDGIKLDDDRRTTHWVGDGASLSDSNLRLFSYRNIGDHLTTNMQIAGQLAQDSSWMVMNWYARTNIPDSPELLAWINATLATFTIGQRVMWKLPLSCLLRRRDGIEDPPRNQEELAMREAAREERERIVAASLWGAHNGNDHGRFSQTVNDQERWLRVARKAIDLARIENIFFVPVRQNFSVQIDTDHGAFRALMASLPSTPSEHHFHPPSIEPGPRVWVHLEGWQTRDVQ